MSQKTLHLKIISGGEVTETCSFSQAVVRIGRVPKVKGEANDVVLKSGAVSGLHARMLFEGGRVSVVDCSRNGTFVNGQMLSAPKQLVPGEEVKIAEFTIRWWVASDVEVASEGPEQVGAAEEEQSLVPEESELPDLNFADLEEPPMPPVEEIMPAAREEPRLSARPTGPLPIIPQAIPQIAPQMHDDAEEFVLSEGTEEPTVHVADVVVAQVVERPPSSELAAAYRSLAKEFGAPGWGRPPGADLRVAPVRELARRLLDSSELQDSELWSNWLAHEICGLDPIQALLDDSQVVSIVVQGEDRVRVLRGNTWEVAARRFSCVEAVFAAIERWTSRRLEEQPIECVRGGLTIRAFGGSLAPLGPMIALQRSSLVVAAASLDDLVTSQVLCAEAAKLLRRAIAGSASILVYGSALATPSIVLQALWCELAEGALALVVRRASEWSPKHALVVDGRVATAEVVWRGVQSVAPEWLFIEEVGLADAAPLCTYARHRGGGTVATVRAASGAAAIGRLTASLAASLGSSSSACQEVVADSFDLVVGLTCRANGRARVVSIAEVRRGGDLAKLFAWKPETSTLEPTGIEPAILRGEAQ